MSHGEGVLRIPSIDLSLKNETFFGNSSMIDRRLIRKENDER